MQSKYYTAEVDCGADQGGRISRGSTTIRRRIAIQVNMEKQGEIKNEVEMHCGQECGYAFWPMM